MITFTAIMECSNNCTEIENGERETDKQEEEILRCKESYADYVEEKIFGLLMPAIEETLVEAKKQHAMPVQKCSFNGIDYLAEILWNRNPRREQPQWLSAFEIPPFKQHLQLYPRPIYPKSWLWSRDEAALRIERYFRGYLVRKREDVQEMRTFWKTMRERGGQNPTPYA